MKVKKEGAKSTARAALACLTPKANCGFMR